MFRKKSEDFLPPKKELNKLATILLVQGGGIYNCSIKFNSLWYEEFLSIGSPEELEMDFCKSSTIATIRRNLGVTG